MSVEQYWQERLLAHFPLWDASLRTEGYDVRSWSGKAGQWPRAIARQSMYHDYVGWFKQWVSSQKMFENQFAAIAGTTPPQPLSELQFFIQIGPWVYVDGKDWHVKNYGVLKSARVNGEWVRVKARRYFIRLAPYERHLEEFQARIGRSIRPLVLEKPSHT